MSAPKSTTARQAKVSSAADFKKRKKGANLLLPSGLTIIAKRVEIRTFLANGDVPNALLPIVEEALNKGKNVDMDKLIGTDEGGVDLQLVKDMYEMVDKVVLSVCVEPPVLPVPTEDDLQEHNSSHPENVLDSPEDLRDEELLYVDEVDDEDKMFLFQWSSGGTSDIATFRREAEAGLVSLVEGKSNRSVAKSGAGA